MYDSYKRIRRVTLLGVLANFLLAVVKLLAGILLGSFALVADAIHSLSDLATDLITLAGTAIASRPPDPGHPYGHGRFDTVAALLVGAALIGGGVYIGWEAGLSLSRGEESTIGYPVLAIAAVSILAKEWLYRVTRKVAVEEHSPALHANAWHHRSDALSSVAVLVGAVASLLGWPYGDQAAALAVGLLIIAVGIRLLSSVFTELTESSITEEDQLRVIRAVESVPGVRGWHRLRTRLVGREVYMDIHVLVEDNISLVEAHNICTAVEEAASTCLDRPVNIVVHCEPYGTA